MKVAILAPSPVPFGIGGAENLWGGLLTALNETAGIQADLIKLPTPERNLRELMASYARHAALDLTHFDRLITTKYPAWMCPHPHHTVYLQHKLRGLYDTYPPGLPLLPEPALVEALHLPPALAHVLLGQRSAESLLGQDLAALAQQLSLAVQALPDGHPGLDFPGPLARSLVHLLDALALHPLRIARHAAISKTVSQRADYFPPGCQVDVFHHPTSLGGLHEGASHTVFSASRLDPAKRIDLIIKAWRRSGIDLPLEIAGSGPDEQRLRALAGDDPRIRFLGRLTETELAKAYARAAFVPFVPLLEDYGLITLEAMLSGKAVLTVSDGGGTTELVHDGETGLIVEPEVMALADAMRRLAAAPEYTAEMGRAGLSRARAISWPALVDFLLQPPRRRPQALPRVLAINTYGMTPVDSGGRLRLSGLYGALARQLPVTFVNLDERLPAGSERLEEVSPGLLEWRIAPGAAWRHARMALDAELGVSAGDLMARAVDLLPEWQQALRVAARQADVVILAHPYGFPIWRSLGLDLPIIYEAHNVECDLKAAVYGDQVAALGQIAEIELGCLAASQGLITCSSHDQARFAELAGRLPPITAVLPNGVDLGCLPQRDARRVAELSGALGKRRPLALFMGSAHEPNRDAARCVMQAAADCPEIDFVIMGSVAQRLPPAALPNLRLLGVVSQAEKMLWLALADVGLNPIRRGGGTNLKLAEHAATGARLVSTAFGARGSGLAAGVHYVEVQSDDLAAACRAALALPEAEAARRAEAARAVVAQSDWRVLGERLAALVRQIA